MHQRRDRGALKISGLIPDLGDESAAIREYARHALASSGRAAVKPLTIALKESTEYGRGQAARALGEIGDPAALPALIQALEDEKFDVRWLAAKAVVLFGRDGLTALLQALVDRPESTRLRQSAHHVLHDAAHGKWSAELAPVKEALEGPDPENVLPVAAARALEALGAAAKT
jgi:HEAT repeat protein